tara:strand:- start:318 stop:833 length:516 start_codon:yes stop_codon:yes gene_type:complete
MPKVKRKRVGDVGIRLKPVENNLLENYNEFSKRRKKTRKKKKKKIKKSKRTVTKSIEIHDKIDPLYKIMEESKDKSKEEIKVKELSDIDKPKKEKKSDIDKPEKEKEQQKEKEESKEKSEEKSEEEPQFKKIQVHEGKADITKKDPNIKTLNITASLEPEKKKKGGGILLE